MSLGDAQENAGKRSLDPLRVLVGFEMNLFSRDDVSDWVTHEIERYDVIPDPLLELTVLAGKHDVEVVGLLRLLVSPTTPEAHARVELGTLRELVRSGRLPRERAVHRAVHIGEDLSRDDYSTALGIEDSFDLAVAGTFGTLREAEEQLDAFLVRFAFPDDRDGLVE